MSVVTSGPGAENAADPFRRRLVDGLAASIEERGYRSTTIADIVRHAGTSKRTFYLHYASKEECFGELLFLMDVDLRDRIRGAVDPEADWRHQIEQAVAAYVDAIEERPAITLAWIRELPALGEVARPLQRRGMEELIALLIALTDGPGFRRAGLPPLSRATALLIVGGLRELTAVAVEDGSDVREIVGPAVDACTALAGPRHWR
ncbi:TetR/AcrR family transcriptional regulator [Mycobacterium sp. MYCO198283]|uniref:TetR/AcrR family transcriptional regulator n=1 Tax=Mycobacterium sp. MYCO198283 TaxID=2883505 RepID=UPI001E5A9653|nr:TetR/AcrR family transcriptional regulator [Mycobacterium sp. MYCO198283]MCG5434394.1 TetR/AcrR family transcriptional regulator [Mycobacterium sp. MYCO198283]